MLKLIRKGAIENPWFFRLLMLGIAVVFAASMGWWGFEQREDNAIAAVGEDRISMEEYQRAYQAAAKFYREIFQDEYDDVALRQDVIDGLVERKLWLQLARKMDLTILDVTLKESITTLPGFQKDGHFDPETYKRVLAFERYTPKSFEIKQREGLLIERVKTLVKGGIVLTPYEIKASDESEPPNPDPEKAIADLLFQKRERGLKSYSVAMKEKAIINIKEDHL
jgi:peptidyl-prolyl cis-trans isomerase D